jgi:hypothetical protein
MSGPMHPSEWCDNGAELFAAVVARMLGGPLNLIATEVVLTGCRL